MNHSLEIKNLAAALSKVQSELEGALKDTTNPFYKSKYADLESVWNSCRGPLTKNGFCVIQTTEGDSGSVFLKTTLLHTSGEWISGMMPLTPTKLDAQGWGSVITYIRRYTLAAIVGVVQTDDDGNAGSKPFISTYCYIPSAGELKGRRLDIIPLPELEAYKKRLEDSFKDEKMPQVVQEIYLEVKSFLNKA